MSTTISPDERMCRIGLSFFEGIGPLRFSLLTDYFGSARAVYHANESKLAETGLGSDLLSRFEAFRKTFDLRKFVGDFQKKGIVALCKEDRAYPKSLLEYKDGPFVVYCRGDISLLNTPRQVAIVGTRRPTRYGIDVTRMFSQALAETGITIVSGMAMGVDAAAHQAALDAGGKTIAVLGCGVDICYPAVNRGLYEKICTEGVVVSEFPPGKRTSRGVFPSRNRIVAGLSQGVLVTEGARKSGSLITARYGIEYGKEVFAVPGPVTSDLSAATTWLLQNGARAVGDPQDILDDLGYEEKTRKEKPAVDLSQLTDFERRIVEYILKSNQAHIDEIARYIGGSVPSALSTVSNLQMRGILVEKDEEYRVRSV